MLFSLGKREREREREREKERICRRITNRCVSTRDDKILLHKRKHLGYVMLPSYLGKLVKYRKNMSPKHWTLLQIIFICCNLSLRPCRIIYQHVAHVIYKRWRHAAISRPPLPRNCLLRSAEPHARAPKILRCGGNENYDGVVKVRPSPHLTGHRVKQDRANLV